MRLALLPPPNEAEFMLNTDYQLILPAYISNPKYREVIHTCSDLGHYMILDNGAAEGETLNAVELYRQAERFGVNEVVVPDVMGDMEATWEIARHWKPESGFRHMVVATGQSIREVQQLLVRYEGLDWITCIGLPRLLPAGARSFLTGYIEEATFANGKWGVHWLGMKPSFMAEMWQFPAVSELVRGVDTSAPFNYAFMHKTLRRNSHFVIERPPGYYNITFNGRIQTFVVDNINLMKELTYGTQAPARQV